jgi:hypothetical protein
LWKILESLMEKRYVNFWGLNGYMAGNM